MGQELTAIAEIQLPDPVDVMVSSKLSTDPMDLTKMPERLDDQMITRLHQLSTADLPIYVPCDRDHFKRCMTAMAIMPRRNDDAKTGKVRASVYWKKLQDYPAPALTWLAEVVHDRLDWFPTVKQCKEILDTWPPARFDRWRKSMAGSLIRQEYDKRWSEVKWSIKRNELSQDGINRLSQHYIDRLLRERLIRPAPESRDDNLVYEANPFYQLVDRSEQKQLTG